MTTLTAYQSIRIQLYLFHFSIAISPCVCNSRINAPNSFTIMSESTFEAPIFNSFSENVVKIPFGKIPILIGATLLCDDITDKIKIFLVAR